MRKMSSNFLICLFLGFSTQAKEAIELDLNVSSFIGGGQILPGDHRAPVSEEDMTIDV